MVTAMNSLSLKYSFKALRFFSPLILLCICLVLPQQGNAQTNTERAYDFKLEVTGQGPDLILIPGLSSNGDVWDETVSELKGDYRCHVISLPGFAGNEPIESDNRFVMDMANQIVQYLKNNGIENPILMGHSMGGFMSLYIASEHPALPSKVVSVDGVPFMAAMINPMATEESGAKMAEQMTKQMKTMAANGRKQMHQNIIATMVSDSTKQAVAVDWSLNSDLETITQSMHALYTTDLRDELDKVEAPILMLGSWKGYENYGVTKEMTERMLQQQYASADRVTIKVSDTGLHFLMWDDFDFMIDSFRAFVSEDLSANTKSE